MTYSVDEKSDSRFPDENFYQYVISHLEETDYDINGIISNEALVNLTTLDCSHKNIESVEGLELLTGLVKLRSHGNKITEINLFNNKNLVDLKLGGPEFYNGQYEEYGNRIKKN